MLIKLPIQPAILALFIAHLCSLKYPALSITSYVSATSYVHQLAAVDHPPKAAIIFQLLMGYRKLAPTRDIHLRITPPIINKPLESFQHTVSSAYQIHLHSATCAISFFAFPQIGEITATSSERTNLAWKASLVDGRVSCFQGAKKTLIYTTRSHSKSSVLH